MTIIYRASDSTILTGCCDEIQFQYSCYTCDEAIPCLNCNDDDHVCGALLNDE